MQTWFITGTSSGFGRGLTERLLARGDRVAAAVRRLESMDELRETAGDRLRVYALDVTDGARVDSVVDQAFADFGRIDVVVNNAGYGLFGAIEEASRDQIAQVIATNLTASIDVARAALPRLRAQGGGRIMQVSSAGGQTAYPGFGIYHAAKWGIEGFCEALAAEVAPFGIAVTIVEPGMTPTGFSAAKDMTQATPAYSQGQFGAGRALMAAGELAGPNDAAKIVSAMIDLVDSGRTPLRLPLGVDTYRDVHAAYTRRMHELEASKDLAESVAATGAGTAP
ncbi:SDR family oxidoreductase [Homoserinibacter sp. YIM 151385]|uniref:SDR family oxidoreductase n=1 Tax=Homoserinibacter sp. YIM 151385 TaxID=2985506 RepID=UPI0022F08FFA|nr:SDR family oxidoreductase [Homoserinibacter sp. YIM 151385]WBU38008.1 SDR family oxidoreductase [Homoserinibacter sp. YIM 151385]